MKEPDPRIIYADIIDLPHHQSASRPHMSLYDRAAQFAPFAALTGYEEMIAEEARQTGTRQTQNQQKLNEKLRLISAELERDSHPLLSFTVFQPDSRKEGGEYIELKGRVKKIDLVSKSIILFFEENERETAALDFDNILDIYGELVDHLDTEIL